MPCGVRHYDGPLPVHQRLHRIVQYWARMVRLVSADMLVPGHTRPPWHPPPPSKSWERELAAPDLGLTQQAWDELDARIHDPDLNWI